MVLIGYHAIHKPQALISSAVVIGIVALFSYLYYRIEKRGTLSSYIDKRLEEEEDKR